MKLGIEAGEPFGMTPGEPRRSLWTIAGVVRVAKPSSTFDQGNVSAFKLLSQVPHGHIVLVLILNE